MIFVLFRTKKEKSYIDTKLRPQCDHLYLDTSVLSERDSLARALEYVA